MVQYLNSNKHELLEAIVRLVCDYHAVRQIYILVRISPGVFAERDTDQLSIERQIAFLHAMLPGNLPVSTIRATGVSAYSGVSLELLDYALKGAEKSLVLSTSLERVIRSAKLLPRLNEILSADGKNHLVMSFIWDVGTEVLLR